MTTPYRRPRPTVVPPRPDTPPTVPPTPTPEAPAVGQQEGPDSRRDRKRLRLERAANQPIVRQRSRSTHRTRERKLSINFNKTVNNGGTAGSTIGQSTQADQAKGVPGANFMSNEDVRAFSEHIRQLARNRAVERGMDAEHLTQVLRHIPTTDGSIAGARMRARRVARHLKAIASAEKLIAKQAAALYAAFEREFESDLRKVGKARPRGQAAAPKAPFTFG